MKHSLSLFCPSGSSLTRYRKLSHKYSQRGLVKIIHKNDKYFNVSITKNHSFWENVEHDNWESNTYKIFNDFLSPHCCYLDIGAWIGPTVLYAAQLAKRAFAFEPDPIAYGELEINMNANKSTSWISTLSIYNKAISSRSGSIKIGSKGLGGDSTSSALFYDESTCWEVPAITLEEVIKTENLQNESIFLKVDIEGGEYELIPALKKTKFFLKYATSLFLSIHPYFIMDRLFKGKRNRLGAKIIRRIYALRHEVKLIRSLPFKYIYRSDATPINLYFEIFKGFVFGHFLTEIVATNKKWDSV